MSKSTRSTTKAAASSSRKTNARQKTPAVVTDAAKTAAVKTDAAMTTPAVVATTAAEAAKTAPTVDATTAAEPSMPILSAIAFPRLPSRELASVETREVVFTLDGWKSLQVLRSADAPEAFQPDRVLLAGIAPGTEVEFAVHLRFGDHGLWLNNGGSNYRQRTA